MSWVDFYMSENLWIAINAFAGAALGASFYVLLRTQPYLVNRSYDPKYNAAYISRFITGIIAGVILSIGLKDQFTGLAKTLTPGVLGILGGYAAEAVELMLQRLVEVLLAAIRGDGSAQVQAKVAAEQANNNAKLQQAAADALAETGDDPRVKAAVQKIRDTLKSFTRTT